jgi:hypothetical protein
MKNFDSNLPTFFMGLKVMVFGMVGIFLVLLLIYVSIKVLIKLFPANN